MLARNCPIWKVSRVSCSRWNICQLIYFMQFRSEGQPRLVRFQGRPSEPTPKARIMSFLGLAPRPFDRHDWYVKRSSSGNSSSSGSKEDDGKIVRYVIDYYEGRDLPGIPVFHLDCRPAIDDFSSLVDRIKHALFNWINSIIHYDPLGTTY